MSLKIIIGLGNPGLEYTKTRHNAGFWLLERLANSPYKFDKKFQSDVSEILINNDKLLLVKPMTFMNLSGQSVQAAMNFYKVSLNEILVVHDELDLPAGVVKYKQGGGHAGHNGLRDIISKCGGNDFLRLRIGIDRPSHSGEVKHYVLKAPSKDDAKLIDEGLYRSEQSLNLLIKDGVSNAMKWLHSE